ncbi:hypothetical protein SSAG_01347 [Streptomyces sp. Mg1]|nr:hypothetical protein SSAG_01347 [Streptomyces sp. Mg1]
MRVVIVLSCPCHGIRLSGSAIHISGSLIRIYGPLIRIVKV